MRLTESVSFWIILFSAIIGFLVGQIHWILGVIVFVLIAGKSAIYGLVMDTISGSLEYHHDRVDARAKKKMESIAFLKYGAQGNSEFKNGKRHGNGSVTTSDGSQYVGLWKDGKMNGQGTLTFSDGSKYVGQWKDGFENGQGIKTFPDGSKYVGQFKNGEYDGQGIMTFPNGLEYVGQWKNGWMDGQGTMTYPDGKTVTGQWKNGDYIGR